MVAVDLLRRPARPTGVVVEDAGHRPCCPARPASSSCRRSADAGRCGRWPRWRLSGHLGLVDRRDRLGMIRQTTPAPVELRRVDRRQVNHRHLDVASPRGATRCAANRMNPRTANFDTAVGRLERDARNANAEPTLTMTPRSRGRISSNAAIRPVDLTQIGDLGRPADLLRIEVALTGANTVVMASLTHTSTSPNWSSTACAAREHRLPTQSRRPGQPLPARRTPGRRRRRRAGPPPLARSDPRRSRLWQTRCRGPAHTRRGARHDRHQPATFPARHRSTPVTRYPTTTAFVPVTRGSSARPSTLSHPGHFSTTGRSMGEIAAGGVRRDR